MTERKTETAAAAPKTETLIDRYRPLGLKAVAAAALHQKPKAATQTAGSPTASGTGANTDRAERVC